MTHSSYFQIPCLKSALSPTPIHPLKPTSAWHLVDHQTGQCVWKAAHDTRWCRARPLWAASCAAPSFKMNSTTSPVTLWWKGKRRGHAGLTSSLPPWGAVGHSSVPDAEMFFPVVLPFPGEADEQTSQLGGHRSSLPGRPDLGVAAVQSGLGKPPSQCLETIKPQGSCISLCVGGRSEVRPVVPLEADLGCAPFLASGELAQCPCHSDLALRVLSDVCSQCWSC